MPSSYPDALDSLTTSLTNDTVAEVTHPTVHNDANDAINKIEAELGVNPSGSAATVQKALSGKQALHAQVVYPTMTTAQIQIVANDLAAAGGGTVIPAPDSTGSEKYVLDGLLDIPNKVDLWTGSPYESVVFLCTTADSQIRFAPLNPASGYRGSTSGGFTIDGNNIANNPLYIGLNVQRTFMDIDVRNAVVDGITVASAQNCTFINVNGSLNGRSQLVLDSGAGNNLFLRCELNLQTRGEWGLMFLQTAPSPVVGFTQPTGNTFIACVIERPLAGTKALIYQGAGQDNVFIKCPFAAPDAVASFPEAAPTYFPIVRIRRDPAPAGQTAQPNSTFLSFIRCKFTGRPDKTVVTVFDTGPDSHVIHLDGASFTQVHRIFFLGDLTRINANHWEDPNSAPVKFENNGGTKTFNELVVNRSGGSLHGKKRVRVAAGNVTVLETDDIVLHDTAALARTCTLPAMTPNLAGAVFTIKNISTGTSAITPNGGTIDGAASLSLGAQYKYATVVTDGANWFVVANN